MDKISQKRLIIEFIAVSLILALSIYVGQLLLGIIAIAALFWLLMLIDCLQRPAYHFPNAEGYDKLIWSLILVFMNFIGAVLYYCLVKKKDKYEKIIDGD